MNKILENKTFLKIISAVIAFALWLIANPISTTTVNLQLTSLNENKLNEKNLTLMNKNYTNKVEVNVRGKKDEVDKILNQDFEGNLDFSRIRMETDGRYYVPVDVQYVGKSKSDINILSITPDQVLIDVEEIEEKELLVEIEIAGTPRAGYVLMENYIIPTTLTLSDIKSKMRPIDKVKVIVDINDATGNIKSKYQCKFYNAEGSEISLEGHDESVEVTTVIGKTVPVRLITKNDPADAVLQKVQVTPEEVVIYTLDDNVNISRISRIDSVTYDLSNLSENKTEKLVLNLPSGVECSERDNINVDFIVEKLIEKNITLGKQQISLTGTDRSKYTYTILTDSANMTLKGKSTDIESINASTLKATADVSGLSSGEASIGFNISLPDGIKIVQKDNIRIKVDKADT